MRTRTRFLLAAAIFAVAGLLASCSSALFSATEQATATPTRTRRPSAAAPTPQPTLALQIPTAAPTGAPPATGTPVQAETPIPAPPTPASTAVPPSPTALPASSTPAPARLPETKAEPAPPATPVAPTAPPPPAVDYVISELRVLGLGENNGGIEGPGAGRTIFVNVVDQSGNPVDKAVVVSASEYPVRAESGDKGPGKAEILMGQEVFRLKVESVGGAGVSSEVSHNLSLVSPVPQDIAGKLGSACPTPDQCPLPPYKHFSYVITFRGTH